jgi:hypothetical protein
MTARVFRNKLSGGASGLVDANALASGHGDKTWETSSDVDERTVVWNVFVSGQN